MDNTCRAIRQRYLSSTGLVSAGGCYLFNAPQNTALPYITFQPLDERVDNLLTGNGRILDELVQFSIYANTASSVFHTRGHLVSAFDLATLSYGTGEHVVCRRIAGTGPERVDETWQATVDYQILRAK